MGYERQSGKNVCDYGYCDEEAMGIDSSMVLHPNEMELIAPTYRLGAIISGWTSNRGFAALDMRLVVREVPYTMGPVPASIIIPASSVGTLGISSYTMPSGKDYIIFVEGKCLGRTVRGPGHFVQNLNRDTVVRLLAPRCMPAFSVIPTGH
jgi:hypothetical protein